MSSAWYLERRDIVVLRKVSSCWEEYARADEIRTASEVVLDTNNVIPLSYRYKYVQWDLCTLLK